jgi:hypothetical protein
MNNYIPTKLKDLTESKQRVMRNVVNEIEKNSRRPKDKWRYVVVTAVLTMSAMLFVLNEIFIENEQQSVTEVTKVTELLVDLEQPTFSEEQGLFYLHGVTLGDSQSRVIELLGENYTKENHEDNTRADLILDYDGKARFYFYEDKLVKILLMKVDKNYFDQLFKDYAGFKFITHASETDTDRFFYLKETGQLLKATTEAPNEDLYLFLIHGGKDLLGNPDFPK